MIQYFLYLLKIHERWSLTLKLKTFILLFLSTFISVYLVCGLYLSFHSRYVPQTEKQDLTTLLNQESFSDADYTILFEQTGLTKPLIDEMRTMPHFTEKIQAFQDNYLREVPVTREYLPPVTISETLEGDAPGFELGPYHNGYILLTKSTHTANWRHGHAGIVIDEVRGITLEALNPGTYSMEQPISKWQYYPTVKMLRLKDTPQSTLDAIAQYAATHLKGLPYNILADKNQGAQPFETHCSLLVWQAFHQFGYDLDATGGLFVSPKNMAMSPLLELLQIYGFNPDEVW